MLGAARSLEAVLHIRRSGVLLDAWTRRPIPPDVVTVMTATLLGSIETLVGALGGTSPESVFVDAEDHRIYASKVDSQSVLVVVAAGDMSEGELRREARRIIAHLESKGQGAVGEGVTTPQEA